jgi:hypothetical protein
MAFGPVSVGSAPYTLPAATASTLGGIKAGKNITIAADGTASAPDPYTLTSDKIAAALGYAPASAASAAQLPYSITYEGSYVGTAPTSTQLSTNNEKCDNYATKANPVKTTLSREYDVVVFINAGENGLWTSGANETCPEKYAFLRLMNVSDKFVYSYVVMGSLTNEWVRGANGEGEAKTYGPVIAENKSPVTSIKYRKNGTTIERYWTREKINSSAYSWVALANGANMLLDRMRNTYHVFGIDIDHRIFVPTQTAAEGEDTV